VVPTAQQEVLVLVIVAAILILDERFSIA
jgi:hypothetical protein